jgi:hypothetical protein
MKTFQMSRGAMAQIAPKRKKPLRADFSPSDNLQRSWKKNNNKYDIVSFSLLKKSKSFKFTKYV